MTGMRDFLLIALFAFLGAAVAGLLGACVLRMLRHRSVAVSLTVVASVTVVAMLAGTLAVAQAMFLSPHDLTVVTTVVAMAAAEHEQVAEHADRPADGGGHALDQDVPMPHVG